MSRANNKSADAIQVSTSAERRLTSRRAKVSKKSSNRKTLLFSRVPIPAICILLALTTAMIYGAVVRHEFIDYDDDLYVMQNLHVNTGLTWENIKWAATTDAVSNWHPLTWMSHALDCQIYGADNPGGHHATSLIVHTLNVVLLFLLLYKATAAAGRSLVVAALFALHPFNVESVAWIAERKNVLCTLFFLLALGAYGWYARKPSVGRYVCIAGLFALGLASKPMVITLPLVLLLLDFWPLRRVEGWSSASTVLPVARAPFLPLLVEKLPLMAISAASAAITVIVQRHGNLIVAFSDSPLSWRLQNAAWAYATYLWKAFFPMHLALFYPTMQLPAWEVALSASFLLAIGGMVWKLSPGRPYLAVGYLWFLGTLVPVIGVIQFGAQSMADRYAYIPLIGVFTAAVWGIYAAARSVGVRDQWLALSALVILSALSIATWKQVSYWQDSISIWSHALDVSIDNFVAEEDLAIGLANKGRDDEAFPHFIAARSIRPDDSKANFNIAINLERQGRHQAAIQQFEGVIRGNPDPNQLFESHRRLAKIYDEIGDLAKARAHLLDALQLKPFDDNALMGDLAELESRAAVEKLSESLSAHPTAQGYYQLGQLLEEIGKNSNARAAYEHVLQLDPNLKDAKKALSNLAAIGK